MADPVGGGDAHPDGGGLHGRDGPGILTVVPRGGDNVGVGRAAVGGVGEGDGGGAEVVVAGGPGDGESVAAAQQLPAVRRRQRHRRRDVIYHKRRVGGVFRSGFAVRSGNPNQTPVAIGKNCRVEAGPGMARGCSALQIRHLIQAVRPIRAVIQTQVDVVGDHISVDVQTFPGDGLGAAEVLPAVGERHGDDGGAVVEDARDLNQVYPQEVGVGVGEGVLEVDDDLPILCRRDGEGPDQHGVLGRRSDHAHVVDPPAVGLSWRLTANRVALKDPAPLDDAAGGGYGNLDPNRAAEGFALAAPAVMGAGNKMDQSLTACRGAQETVVVSFKDVRREDFRPEGPVPMLVLNAVLQPATIPCKLRDHAHPELEFHIVGAEGDGDGRGGQDGRAGIRDVIGPP